MSKRIIEAELEVAYKAVKTVFIKERIDDNNDCFDTFFGRRTVSNRTNVASAVELFPNEEDRIINASFRGQISAFGAAVATNSLAPSIAFYCHQGNASVNRKLILYAVDEILSASVSVFNRIRTGYGENKPSENSPELRLFKFAGIEAKKIEFRERAEEARLRQRAKEEADQGRIQRQEQLNNEANIHKDNASLQERVSKWQEINAKSEILNAITALKLALQLFPLINSNDVQQNGQE